MRHLLTRHCTIVTDNVSRHHNVNSNARKQTDACMHAYTQLLLNTPGFPVLTVE